MGITPNLKLTTISEQDNPKVKDFFQDLAGDVATSNMQKIDAAYLDMLNEKDVFFIHYDMQRYPISSTIDYSYSDILLAMKDGKLPVLDVTTKKAGPVGYQTTRYYFSRSMYDNKGKELGLLFVQSWLIDDLAGITYYLVGPNTTVEHPSVSSHTEHLLVKKDYDQNGAIKDAGGIEAWSSGKFIPTTEKGVADGVAKLDKNGKVEEGNIPTLDHISDGTTRKAVTQAEKNTWNAKSNFSGSYNDLANKPNLDFIPTSDKGDANGVAPLDKSRKIPQYNLWVSEKYSDALNVVIEQQEITAPSIVTQRVEYTSFNLYRIYVSGKFSSTINYFSLVISGFEKDVEDSLFLSPILSHSSILAHGSSTSGVFYADYSTYNLPEGPSITCTIKPINSNIKIGSGTSFTVEMRIFSPKTI